MAAPLSRLGWASASLEAPRAVLGWSGSGTPGLAEVDGIAVVLDGHVYNCHALGPGTVAELIAGLYRKHGFDELMVRLEGDFAIALYDRGSDTLWLGRDVFGVKPLYYVSRPGGLAFASRMASLLRVPGVSKKPDPRFVALFAASHYRYFDNAPERSPLADIAQVPPAHLLQAEPAGIRVRRYWTLCEQPDWEESEAALAERYRALLIEAIRSRLGPSRSTFTLSGGMDSSSVLAGAVHMTGAKQHAFSTVYADRTYDESREIRSVLDALVEEWHPVAVGTPDLAALVERLIGLHDEPVATATWLPHFLLCHEMERLGFECVFGGLGGDELNAGEYEHFLYHFADLKAAGRESDLAHEVESWARHHDHPIFRKNRSIAEQALSRLVDLDHPGWCRPDRVRLERYAGALRAEVFDLRGFEPVMERPFRSYLKNRTFQDLTRETLPCCLRAADRNESACGLEGRLPFLDRRLVEFMFRIPGDLKIRDGVTKHLLREAMRGILPEPTRTRVTKTGWNAPAHVWFVEQKNTLLDLVASRGFRERGIYDPAVGRRLIEEHAEIVTTGEPRENHMMFLWQMLNLELWFRWLATLPAAGE
jgi:asparagine synthase (glutamine-hydrolysing)